MTWAPPLWTRAPKGRGREQTTHLRLGCVGLGCGVCLSTFRPFGQRLGWVGLGCVGVVFVCPPSGRLGDGWVGLGWVGFGSGVCLSPFWPFGPRLGWVGLGCALCASHPRPINLRRRPTAVGVPDSDQTPSDAPSLDAAPQKPPGEHAKQTQANPDQPICFKSLITNAGDQRPRAETNKPHPPPASPPKKTPGEHHKQPQANPAQPICFKSLITNAGAQRSRADQTNPNPLPRRRRQRLRRR